MRPARTPQAAPEAPVRLEFQIRFDGGPKGRRRDHEKATPSLSNHPRTGAALPDTIPENPSKRTSRDRLPKITKLLVLAHHFESLVREGVVKDYAEIARLTGLSRARVTQIVNLALLAPGIQEAILASGHTPHAGMLVERQLRRLTSEAIWRR